MNDRYLPGVPCWVDTNQPDPDAAVAFYSALFGWEFENVMPAGAPAYHVARLDGGDVAAVGGPAETGAAWNTYVWVADADETVAKVRAAGGQVLSGPIDHTFYYKVQACLSASQCSAWVQASSSGTYLQGRGGQNAIPASGSSTQ